MKTIFKNDAVEVNQIGNSVYQATIFDIIFQLTTVPSMLHSKATATLEALLHMWFIYKNILTELNALKEWISIDNDLNPINADTLSHQLDELYWHSQTKPSEFTINNLPFVYYFGCTRETLEYKISLKINNKITTHTCTIARGDYFGEAYGRETYYDLRYRLSQNPNDSSNPVSGTNDNIKDYQNRLHILESTILNGIEKSKDPNVKTTARELYATIRPMYTNEPENSSNAIVKSTVNCANLTPNEMRVIKKLRRIKNEYNLDDTHCEELIEDTLDSIQHLGNNFDHPDYFDD